MYFFRSHEVTLEKSHNDKFGLSKFILNVIKLVNITRKENTALKKLFHWEIRLAFLRTANSSALGLTGNQLIEMLVWWDCPPFLKSENWWKIARTLKNFWARKPFTFRKLRWKKTYCASRFFIFYAKQKINLT